MIVDVSALPEQVVSDALTSAFDTPFQRCSALRILCLQQDGRRRKCSRMLEVAMREPFDRSSTQARPDVGL